MKAGCFWRKATNKEKPQFTKERNRSQNLNKNITWHNHKPAPKKIKHKHWNLKKWMHLISKVILPHRLAPTLYVPSHHRQNMDFHYFSRSHSTIDFQILFVYSTSPYVWSLSLFLAPSKNDIAWCWKCWLMFVSSISVIQGRAVQENFGFSAKFWQEQTFEENKAQLPDIYPSIFRFIIHIGHL